MAAKQSVLVRKQIMLTNNNIIKLEKIAKARHLSVAEVVRTAVDSYDPDHSTMGSDELMELVASKLKEAIDDTAKTRKKLDRALTRLEKEAA